MGKQYFAKKRLILFHLINDLLQVTRVYAYMGHAHAQHLVNKSPFSSSSSSTPLVPSPLPFTLIIPLITLIAITLSAICFAMW